MALTKVGWWRALSDHYSDALNVHEKAYPKVDCNSVHNWTVPTKVEW